MNDVLWSLVPGAYRGDAGRGWVLAYPARDHAGVRRWTLLLCDEDDDGRMSRQRHGDLASAQDAVRSWSRI